jgi:arylsulfatase A-like enzyme
MSNLSRRDILALPALTALAANAQTPATRPPNIIVIVTDDHGIGDIGCYEHPEVRTPNLDRLAASGVRFTQWYSNAPICSASRAAIMTGKYPDRTGVVGALPSEPGWDVQGLRAGETTIATVLRKLGYNTAAFGKWHLGSIEASRPYNQGFDSFFGWYSGWLDAYSHRYYQLGSAPGKIFHDLWRNREEVFEEPAYMTEVLGREARAFLAKQTKQKPFFQYLAFGAPHYSMMAPKKYLDRFPATMERDRRTHLAMVAAVDDVIGSILDQVKRQGMENETVIFFQADNGATREVRASSKAQPYTGGSNEPFRGFKQGLFDGGMHVPAILRAPGRVKPGTVWNRPMISMDLLPTLVSLADPTAVPKDIDGQNILPVLRGDSPEHEVLFWSFNDGRAIRQGDWKLLLNPPQFPGEPVPDKLWLSNLEADKSETKNLANEQSARVQEMLAKIREWEKKVGLKPAP